MTYRSRHSLLRDVCHRCKVWVGQDIVHALVRIPHEMKSLEEQFDAIFHGVHLHPFTCGNPEFIPATDGTSTPTAISRRYQTERE
jgi:hypothetical protein